jgi:carboxymethylenebutenolidase
MPGKMIAQGWLSLPAKNGVTKADRGVVVIQEWWGLVPHIKDVADRLAGEGFVAIAPDLWEGKQTTRPDQAGELFMSLDVGRAERQIADAIAALREHGAQGKVGVVGFCMGGILAVHAATKNADVGAAVSFYGIHPKVKPDYRTLKAPVLGLFGETDASVPPAAAEKMKQDITDAGGSCEIEIYPAGHAFFNDSRPEAYDAAAAAAAWKRTLAFFRQHLA